MSAGPISRVAVVGLGKVGELVALLLDEAGFTVTGLDRDVRRLAAGSRPGTDLVTRALDVTDPAALVAALGEVDAVVACLPVALNAAIAEAAAATGTHYVDLTEDVATTARTRELATLHPDVVFAPQCGLAPGLIGMIGADLAGRFDDLRSIELKVGALPQNPTGLLGYAFTWSAAGVVNEYLRDCEVLRAGRRQMVPALTEKERVVIGGLELEAALTSGGLGTLCETYEGRVHRLDYKTLRYPGHFDQMHFLFDELRLAEQPELAGRILVDAKPPVSDDVVYVHASAEGVQAGQPVRENHVRAYLPQTIGAREWRAISWTTAASAVGVVELVARGVLPQRGFIRQEQIALEDLFATRAGSLFAKAGEVRRG